MKYISILRGINVGGKRKIKMADLKSLYETMDFINVRTYIQSGNVIFEFNSEDKEKIINNIKSAIREKFGFEIPVILLYLEEIRNVINNCPFSIIDPEKDGNKVAVTFLSSEPPGEKFPELEKFMKPDEKLVPGSKEVYLYCPGGFGKTKLTNDFLERKLGVEATTRNWRTVRKLAELAVK